MASLDGLVGSVGQKPGFASLLLLGVREAGCFVVAIVALSSAVRASSKGCIVVAVFRAFMCHMLLV